MTPKVHGMNPPTVKASSGCPAAAAARRGWDRPLTGMFSTIRGIEGQGGRGAGHPCQAGDHDDDTGLKRHLARSGEKVRGNAIGSVNAP
jgi:hypothetical protein